MPVPGPAPLSSSKAPTATALLSTLQSVRLRLDAVPAGGGPPEALSQHLRTREAAWGPRDKPTGSALDSPQWG